MIALKLLGSFFMLLTGIGAAISTARFERQRITVLSAWGELISYVRGQIDGFLLPIDEILRRADHDLIRGCMCTKEEPTPEELLEGSRLYLTPEAHRLIASFVREVGRSNREEQVRRCDYYVDGLEHVRTHLSKDLPSRIRGQGILLMTMALAVTILMW